MAAIGDPRGDAALLGALKGPDAVPVVAAAYEFFIKQGVPGSESVMIQALKAWGNEAMAEEFLNCGNTKLEDPDERAAGLLALRAIAEAYR